MWVPFQKLSRLEMNSSASMEVYENIQVLERAYNLVEFATKSIAQKHDGSYSNGQGVSYRIDFKTQAGHEAFMEEWSGLLESKMITVELHTLSKATLATASGYISAKDIANLKEVIDDDVEPLATTVPAMEAEFKAGLGEDGG